MKLGLTLILVFLTLAGCTKNEGTILPSASVLDDMQYEQTFTFVLKYGYGQIRGNVIDTVDNRLVKDLLNGEVAEVNDFVLTPEEQRAIYKEMLLAGYQMPKELTLACNMKPHIRYDLKVNTPQDDYRYQWSECDKSRDGEAMTRLVNSIIEVVQARKEYQELPPVVGGVAFSFPPNPTNKAG